MSYDGITIRRGLLALVLGLPWPLAAVGAPQSSAQLLESSLYWQAQGRVDLARQAIEKLLNARPGDPALLYRLGEIDLALDPEHCHEPLARMRKQVPDDHRTDALAAECFAATTGRLRLARIVQMHDSGRSAQAAEELLGLFTQGPPLSRTGLIYYEILAAANYPYDDIRRGMQTLASRFPEDAQIQLAYAGLLARTSEHAREAIRQVQNLVSEPAQREQALRIWRSALAALRDSTEIEALRTAYLQRDPGSGEIRRQSRTRKSVDPARKRAKQLLDRGARGSAIAYLGAEVSKAPGDAWLRYDLASTYLSLGLPEHAAPFMLDGLNVAPNDPDMRHASALILKRMDEPAAAYAQLAAVPASRRSDSMRQLMQELGFDRCLENAQKPGRREPKTALIECETLADGQPTAWRRMAQAWSALDAELGSERVARWLYGQSRPPGEVMLEWVRLLRQAERWQQLDRALDHALLSTAGTPAFAATLREKYEYLLLRAEQAIASDNRTQGLAILEQADANSAGDARALFALAELQANMGLQRAAAATYLAALQRDPERPWARLRYIELRIELGQADEAARQLETLFQTMDQTDESLRYVALLRLKRLQRPELMDAALQDALIAHPGSVRLRLLASDAALDAGDARAATRLLEAALDLDPTPDQREQISARLAGLADRQHGDAEAGWAAVRKPGRAGISAVKLDTLILAAHRPWGLDRRWSLQLDAIAISAGRLSADAVDDYAQFATLPPAQRPARVPDETQDARGFALQGELAIPNWTMRLGLLQLGDATSQRIIGELEYRQRLGHHGLGVALARRPVASTLLSYAGATDPVSQRAWGAVMRNSAQLSLSRYTHAFDYSGSLRLDQLAGKNTRGNDGLRLRLAASRELWHRPAHHLSLDLGLSYWRYDNDQGHYSFGHGGYYSPQSYLSLRAGLDLRGHHRRFSYLARIGIGRSSSSEDPSPYFPNDPALQAEAEAIASANGEAAPVYAGGDGGGTGLSGALALEYGLSRLWSLGVHYGFDRSDFYEPDAGGLYLRRELDNPWSTPYVPPRPPRPIAEF